MSAASLNSNKVFLPRSFFQQSLLQLFLALDAVARPGHSFETLGINFFAAVDAFAEAAFADADEGLVDHLQESGARCCSG